MKRLTLIIGLEILLELNVKTVDILRDSQLVLKQIAGEYKCINPQLASYLVAAHNLLQEFTDATWEYIPRDENFAANEMAHLASIQFQNSCSEHLFQVKKRSLPLVITRGMDVDIHPVDLSKPDWRSPIIRYLQYPELHVEHKTRTLALNYLLWNGELVWPSKDDLLL
ncbi:hypothetical protein L3X38_042337 [Prunus dulcis]|uniref:RNase H type-1 domain-containing protein n=1 Tax=Prunus dulcis TaxID=3755 RepID=A0AAD4YLW0_PRUDU|nr:hypothetical protein L3X38_042337 [Prunus dulcis]